jgi:hypothetical protein
MIEDKTFWRENVRKDKTVGIKGKKRKTVWRK